MLKRTSATITYTRTVQLAAYSPVTVTLTTTLENDEGWNISKEDIDKEYKSIQEFCDGVLEEKLSSVP